MAGSVRLRLLEDAGPADMLPAGRAMKGKKGAAKKQPDKPARKKKGATAEVAGPECIIIGGEGSCPEWHDLLGNFPMIDSIQREDFPAHGASFVYLAHFYRTGNTAEEGSRAQEEFEDFFKTIGYTYDYSGNYDSRWFEGIGVKTS